MVATKQVRSRRKVMSMQKARDVVLEELKRRGWSNYALVTKCKHRGCSERSVYRFLAGESDIIVSNLDVIFDVLGLSYTSQQRDAEPGEQKP